MTAPTEGGPATEAEYEAENSAKPDRGEADDGKTGGQEARGRPAPPRAGDGIGINAQNGEPSGAETERNAPGISTDKKIDDTK